MSLVDKPMLKNGSNPEGVMPSPAIVWDKPEDLKDVMVHGPFLSPPVTKVRLYLIHGGIKYSHFQHFISNSGIRPGPYTKVPSLDVGGRQINDSYIILKMLCPAIGLEYNEEWEKKFVLGLDTAIKLRPTDEDWAKIAHTFIGMPMCLARPFARNMYGPLERTQAANNIKGSGLGHSDVDEMALAKEFRAAIGDKKFFGGDTPGSPDLSFYGVLANFLKAECDISDNIIRGGGLEQWLENMQKLYPLKAIFDDVPASKW